MALWTPIPLEPTADWRNIFIMDHEFRNRPVIDMTPDGEFKGPVPSNASWLDRMLVKLGGAAVLVAMVAGGIVVAGLAVAFFALALPVAILAGLVAFGSLWWRARRAGQQGRGFVHAMRR